MTPFDKAKSIFNAVKNSEKINKAAEKSLKAQADFQNTLLEQKKELQKAIINIAGPKNSLSSELYPTTASGSQSLSGLNTGLNSGWWYFDNSQLRKSSRIAYWECPTGGAILDRLADTVIGSGLELQSNPIWSMLDPVIEKDELYHKIWTKKTESRFRMWAKQNGVDYLRERNLYQLQRAAFFYMLRDGEYFLILRYSQSTGQNPLTIQIIPPENITGGSTNIIGNRIINGIEYNTKDEAIAYHIYNENTGTTERVIKYGPKSGRTFVMHRYIKDNEKQRRGIPLLSRSLPQLTKLADYQQLEVQAAIINALFAVWVEPPEGLDGRPTIAKGIAAKNNTSTTIQSAADWDAKIETMDMAHGGIIVDELPAGHKIHSFESNRPSSGFEKFNNALKREITARNNIPLSVVDYDFNSAYSAARGELIMFWFTVDRMRYDFSYDFCDEIYRMWLWGEIDADKIKAPGWNNAETRLAWSNANWNGNQRPDIDPLKSVNAHEKEHKLGYKTGQQITAERGGGDYDENLEKIKPEFKTLADAIRPIIDLNKTNFGK